MRPQSISFRLFVVAACAAVSVSVAAQTTPPVNPAVKEPVQALELGHRRSSGYNPTNRICDWSGRSPFHPLLADAQLSADVVVRPDGKISVPLLNDVQAAGLTPEQLNAVLEKAASKYIAEPDATVIVREVRSRKVYVLGQVARPNQVPLNTDMNVLQVLTAVGGLLEYADKSNIVILRLENGRERRLKFNYNDVVKGKNVQQNILLQPGDTVVVN
jgi:polysaccharide export outer membrane protein